jgi:signal transduction histidine kinase
VVNEGRLKESFVLAGHRQMSDGLALLSRALAFVAAEPELGQRDSPAFMAGFVDAVADLPLFSSGTLRLSLEAVRAGDAANERLWTVVASTDPGAETGVEHSTGVGLTGWAIRTGRTSSLLVHRREFLPEEVELLPSLGDVQTAFIWVIRRGREPIGAVCLVSHETDAISPSLRQALDQLCRYLKVALAGATESHGTAETTQRESPGSPLEDASIDDWIATVALQQAIRYDYAVYWRWDAQVRRLRPKWLRCPADASPPSGWPGDLELGHGFAGRCAQERRKIVENRVRDGHGAHTGITTPYPFIVGQVPIRSTINIPVMDADRVYGVVSALSDSDAQFDDNEPQLEYVVESLAERLRRADDQRLGALQRGVADRLLRSLDRPDRPTVFWDTVSGILKDLEQSGLCLGAALFVGRRQEPDVFTCKSASPMLHAYAGLRIDSRRNASFRHLLAAREGIHQVGAQLRPPLADGVAPPDARRFWLKHYPTNAAGTTVPTLVAISLLDDEDHWAGSYGRRDPGPSLSQVFLFVSAVTRAILTAADMERQDRTRLHIMSAVTHQVRAPVAAIRVTADVLAESSTGTIARQMRKIVSLTGDALLSIDNLLYQWAKEEDDRTSVVNRSRQSATTTLLEVEAFCRTLHQEFQRNNPDERVILRAVPVPEVRSFVVPTSLGLLDLVLKNVLGNAVKFGRHAPIEFRVHPEDERHGGGSTRWLKLEVRDRGIGVPADKLKAIFERGMLHPHSRREVTVGARTGLSITKAIIEGFGGRVWAESAGIGKGTTMHILCPLLEAKP